MSSAATASVSILAALRIIDMMHLEWWWDTATETGTQYVCLDVPSRDYAVGVLSADLNDGPAYEADFIGKALTGLVLRNYAEVSDGDTTFHVRLF